VEETVVRPGEPSGPHAAEHAPKGILRISILPDKKIKKFCRPASTKKDYFRIFRPTKTVIKASVAKTSVASGPVGPDAKAAPALLPRPEETKTARMLNRLPAASATVSLSLSR
jgi:hypothetical protein